MVGAYDGAVALREIFSEEDIESGKDRERVNATATEFAPSTPFELVDCLEERKR